MYRLLLDVASQEVRAKEYLEMGWMDRMEQGISLKYIGDFDADGVDEILELHESDAHGIVGTSLVALLLNGPQFREVLNVTVSYDDAGFHVDSDKVTTCRGSVDIQPPQGSMPRILRFRGKIEHGQKAHDNDCIAGQREFVLTNGKFVAR